MPEDDFVSPERVLIAAVLKRALADYVGPSHRLASEAERWLFADGRTTHSTGFTMHWICEQLDLDPMQVRAAARRLREGADQARRETAVVEVEELMPLLGKLFRPFAQI